jgi:hypothetical protein
MTDTKPEENKKPKALQLAEWFETSPNTRDKQGAAELRRLHEVNAELVEALTDLLKAEWKLDDGEPELEKARAKAREAIAKATGETNA